MWRCFLLYIWGVFEPEIRYFLSGLLRMFFDKCREKLKKKRYGRD